MAKKAKDGEWNAVRGDYNPAFGRLIAEVKVPARYSSSKYAYERVGIQIGSVQHQGDPPAHMEGEKHLRLFLASSRLLAFAKKYCELFRDSDMRPEDDCHDLYSEAKALIDEVEEAPKEEA